MVNRDSPTRFFNGGNPVGRQFSTREPRSGATVYQIVGLTEDALYNSMRAELSPTVYLPLAQADRLGQTSLLASAPNTAIDRSGAQPRRRARAHRLARGLSFVSMSDQVGRG